MSKRAPADWFILAPKGSPDKFVTTKSMRFVWWNPPQWAWDLVKEQVQDNDGLIRRCETQPRRCIELLVRAGFFFSTSVAPDFEEAMPGVCAHDWLCAALSKLAIAWGCPMRDVWHFAARFFYALLCAGTFNFKYTWYYGVDLLGYTRNRIAARFGSTFSYIPRALR